MEQEAFVYLWYDASNKKYYLGSHDGHDPNYAHSSSVMEKFTLKTTPPHMHRRILARGTHQEMVDLEIELLNIRKERCWDRYYNVMTSYPPPPMYGENHPNFGKKLSQETKEKLSKKLSGKNNPMFGRTGEKHPMFGMTGESNPNFGRKHTPEALEKMCGENNSMYGKKHTPETLEKMSEKNSGENNPMYGKKHTPEALEKMSGENNPMYGKRGKNNPNFGRKQSQETKEKRSKSLREYWQRKKQQELEGTQ